MKKFWGYTSNGQFSIGCTGQTVYLLDETGKEINKFKDITYGYTPMISPDGKFFVVKSTAGRLAVYSLETLSLIKKFPFSKVDCAQDDGFCFSSDGRLFFNVERQGDDLHSAISVYDTSDFSRISQLLCEEDKMIHHIEFNKETHEYFVLGSSGGEEGYDFVGKYKENSIIDIVEISEDECDFYAKYKHLELMGFTEKAYEWSYIDCELEELKNMKLSLAKLHNQRGSSAIFSRNIEGIKER